MDGTPTAARTVVGVMTGTSIDGLDAALVRIDGRGLEMRAALVRHGSYGLGGLGASLREAAEQTPLAAGEFTRLAWEFGNLHANVIGELLGGALNRGGLNRQDHPDLICVHGQTVFHQPPCSWQLVNAAPIAQRFNCPVVSDLRQADLAAGGQGAPITPIADWIMFRDAKKSRAIVNLGGFCNVTILPFSREPSGERVGELEAIRGFDVCACNQILDGVARAALGKSFDDGGHAAARGRAKPQAAEGLYAILLHQGSNRRSLGTGDEAVVWIEKHAGAISADDLAASAVDAVARCIGERLNAEAVDEAIVAGGGARNKALIDALRRAAPIPWRLSDELGVPIDAREAMAFAILGALCADGVSISLPQVTECSSPAPLAGIWTCPNSCES